MKKATNNTSILLRTVRSSMLVLFAAFFIANAVNAQELNCRVTVDYRQIQGTNTDVFTSLERALTSFINERQWSNDIYVANERIACSMLLNVKEYANDGTFKVDMVIVSSRPVYGSSYTATVLNLRDTEVSFRYNEGDRLEFRIEQVEQGLTAIIAYYAYLIIGCDKDTFAEKGGADMLTSAMRIVAAAQSWSETGWKAFDNTRNRHAILTDYMDEAMSPYRQSMYIYHRLGLDTMSENAELGREHITTAINLVREAQQAKSMSALPQVFTEAKRDELVGIYSKAPEAERNSIYEVLSDLNPSLRSSDWDKIKRPEQ